MHKYFFQEIETLKKQLLTISAIVEDRARIAMKSVRNRDVKLAESVIKGDFEIDHMEVDLEEECLKILALHQPVATDLRFVISILKINNDLERIGDLAVNIAERAKHLACKDQIDIPPEIFIMSEKTQSMLESSIDSLVKMDTDIAAAVCQADDEVDNYNRNVFEYVKSMLPENPSRVDCLLQVLLVARHLERIADHATNIAEDIVYMIDGEIVRHRMVNYRSRTNSN